MGDLTHVTAGQQLDELSADSSLSVRPLKKAEITQFEAMMAGMIAYYPHQEIPEPTLKQFRAEFRLMAAQHGIALLRQALLDTRRQPGRRFYPHPNEVSEVLEEMAAKVKAKAKADLLAKLPRIGCEKCQGEDGFTPGLVMVQKPGQPRIVDECECKLAWRRAKKELEAKA
jgi:hypothetical protein